MKRSVFNRALLAASAFVGAAATAQTPPAPAEQARELDEAKARIEQLQAQVDALQKSISQIQAQMAKETPSWKGAPQLEDKICETTSRP